MATEVAKVVQVDPASLVFTAEAPTRESELKREFGGTEYKQKFTQNEAKTLEDAMKICLGLVAYRGNKEGETDETILVSFFNQSCDLYVRARLAPKLEESIEGPSKLIEKAAKNYAAIMQISVDEARDFIVTQRKSKGLAV